MKRVVCLYRVSTLGQVDHDDIPMQKEACHEFVDMHPDWAIVREISEKGVSGYKVSTNARDAIVEIKRMAAAQEFDVLLVFMFDRLGRRDDETPFVVQWFAQHGIEVWSTREGEQRFDSHVDKLMNYIRFWQASGESEKTAIRVKTKHSQMVQAGEYRGGLVPYGYHLEFLGRTNKKEKPVPDLVIDEYEAEVVKTMVHLIVDEGYGSHRIANWLNDRGIKTKRGTSLWRDTSIRALLSNPIYIGIIRFGKERSKPFERLRILDDERYQACLDVIHQRAPKKSEERELPLRTDGRGLLAGLLYCKDCGSRLAFTHNTTKKRLADGNIRVYERDLYRCYQRLNSRKTCTGQSSYRCDLLNDAVKEDVRRFFARIKSQHHVELLEIATKRRRAVSQLAYDQALAEYTDAQDSMNKLKEQNLLSLKGKSSYSIDMLRSMEPECKARLEETRAALEAAKKQLEDETALAKEEELKLDKVLNWAERFDKGSVETQHMILAALIERIEVGRGNKLTIHYRLTAEQFFNAENLSTSEISA